MLRGKRLDVSNGNDAEAAYRSVLRKHDYQFMQVIGKGGMSRVDEVRHLTTGKLKAIKHLGNSLPPEKVERFKRLLRRETEYSFDHPNVLKGEDYFEEQGRVFYVMPRMQHNLDYLLLDESKYDLSFLLDIIIQIAAGLNYLHQNDIIHRDLKPSNILYNMNGSDIWVVICDFGLSQDKMAKFKTDVSRILRGRRGAGTLNYAAPEQLHKDKKYDKRCDLYSLGRVMDELVGRKAEHGKEFLGTFREDRKLDSLSRKIYLYKMDRPYVLEGESRRYIPYSLTNLILRCLQKHPQRRPSDIVQIFYELTKIQRECRMANGISASQMEVSTYRGRI